MNWKKYIKFSIVCIVVFSFLCACEPRELYKDFKPKYISNPPVQATTVARVNDVIMDVEIKAVGHNESTVYRVYLEAKSRAGTEKIVLKRVYLKNDDKIFLEADNPQEIIFDEQEGGLNCGTVTAGEFEAQDDELPSGENLHLEFEVEVENEEQTIIETIEYEVEVMAYVTWLPYL